MTSPAPGDYRLQAAHLWTDILVARHWCIDHHDQTRMDKMQRHVLPIAQRIRDLDKANARGQLTMLITTARSTITKIMAGSGWNPRPPEVAAAIQARGTSPHA